MEETAEKELSIYGEHLPMLVRIIEDMEKRIDLLRESMKQQRGMDPVEHCLSRIKSEESMREKCVRKGLAQTPESALFEIHDAIGFRIVCAFVSDVYMIRDYLAEAEDLEIVEEKDYIRNAKPNGYRSYHMILKTQTGYYLEIQLRTISMDTWAALEHHLKYKKTVSGNEQLIVRELKRCADELASTDVSMQTIRDMIFEEA
ncbi:MAG: GTP pyrophosphokinase family protein [Lachnospiraceae bacterium]|nr:GTP pyrophosphokinase family protein [Lachnospiraceae bacterium]